MTDTNAPSETCACCGALSRMFDRRRFLYAAGAASFLIAGPSMAQAAPKSKYQAMVLSCIDPRFQRPVFRAMTDRGLKSQYSKFTVAGASIGVVAPAFKKWHKTFWDNLGASVELHSITQVIAINHRDCGAAKIAYGKEKLTTPADARHYRGHKKVVIIKKHRDRGHHYGWYKKRHHHRGATVVVR